MKKDIKSLRETLTTRPYKGKKTYEYMSIWDSRAANVKIVDATKNPYKNMVSFALATWGSGRPELGEGSTEKWKKLSPKDRYKVALAVLTRKTLPLALETVSYTFEANGFPRHTFDQIARARIGATFASIGVRDNDKLDAPLILYPELMKMIKNNPELKKQVENTIKSLKDTYEAILKEGLGSYQAARAFLPMSTNHSWLMTFNLASLSGVLSKRLKFCEEAPIVLLAWRMRGLVYERTPLIANYLRPGCDYTRKCDYAQDGIGAFFSNLFKGCGRWPAPKKDLGQEFNISCSDIDEFRKNCKFFVEKDGWIDYTEDDYDNLDERDKRLFEDED